MDLKKKKRKKILCYDIFLACPLPLDGNDLFHQIFVCKVFLGLSIEL